MTRHRWALVAVLLIIAIGAGVLLQQRRAAARVDHSASTAASSAPAAPGDAATSNAAGVSGRTGAPGSKGAATATSATLVFGPRDVLRIEPSTIGRSIPLTGTLRPVNQTVVRAKVAGELRDMPVREGSTVKAGQVIARIDPVDFEHRLAERQAQLRQIEAQLAQARRTLDTNTQLLEKQFISQSAHDQARYAYEGLVAARDAANVQLAMARKALADATIVAPFAGVIVERFAQPGEKVSADTRIVSLIDLSRMEIEAMVPASEIGAVSVGQTVSLNVEGVDEPQQGRVVRISPSTLSGTRSVPVYIGLDNRDPNIRGGLFAQGRLVTTQHQGAIVVPETAVHDNAGRTFVYLIDGERLVEREVRTGLRDTSVGGTPGVEIVEGLKVGDRIVGVNLGALRAGSAVRIDSPAAH